MNPVLPAKESLDPTRNLYWLKVIAIWTFCISSLFIYAISQSKSVVTQYAALEAKTNIDKDLAYRMWVAEQGGVYVATTGPASSDTYLNVPNHEVVTTQGTRLSLVNPAEMSRQAQNLAINIYGLRGHLTSLKPLRPENDPDAWEETALEAIEKGAGEVTSPAVEIEGKLYLRQMRSLILGKNCLKCHTQQGDSEGEIRGGISVAVPLEPYEAHYQVDRNGTIIRYAIIWMIGLGGIWGVRRNLQQSSASLQASERRFRMLIDQAPEGIIVFDAETESIVDVNSSVERLLMCGRSELLQSNLLDFYTEEQPDGRSAEVSLRDNIQRALAGKEVRDNHRVKSADGRELICEVRLALLPSEQGTLIRQSFIDITQRTESERQLRDVARRLELAASSAHLGVWDWDVHDGSLIWDQRTMSIYGADPQNFTAKIDFWRELIHPEDRAQVWESCQSALRRQDEWGAEFRINRSDDTTRWVKMTGEVIRDQGGDPLRMLGITLDITDRIQAEEERILLQQQLDQAQKMESVGRLAGGIAHDFNNILTVISGYSSLLRMDASLNDAQKAKVGEILTSVERASQLTRGLLAFSRKQPMQVRQVDVNDIILQTQKFLERIIGEDISIRTEVSEIDLPVHADRGQIEQVLINLATNARDAMPSGGVFTVRSEFVSLQSPVYTVDKKMIPSGSYALLAVTDTGIGISTDDLERIFEPFFTTKEVGKGTGLGMSIIYGIVIQHNGFINVRSEVGLGTTVQIYLPVQGAGDIVSSGKTDVPVPLGGSETILVAEDDQGVRALLAEVLKSYGYEVILAEDGVEAVEKFRLHEGQIRLVLMDMIMPRMNGRDAYEAIRKYRPVNILFLSGYTADYIESRGLTDVGPELLMKPVQPEELLKRVRAMLDV